MVKIMGRTYRADDDSNQKRREQLATQQARLELVRRLDQARKLKHTNAHYQRDNRKNFATSKLAILVMVFAVLGAVASIAYLLVFGLR